MLSRTRITQGPPSPTNPDGRSEATDSYIGIARRGNLSRSAFRSIIAGPGSPLDPGGRSEFQDTELEDIPVRKGGSKTPPPPCLNPILRVAA